MASDSNTSCSSGFSEVRIDFLDDRMKASQSESSLYKGPDLIDGLRPPPYSEDITFCLMLNNNGIFTIPLALATTVSAVWADLIFSESVYDAGLGRCLRFTHIDPSPFCNLLYWICSLTPGYEKHVRQFEWVQLQKRSHIEKMMMLLNTLVYARSFRITTKGLDEKILRETQDGIAEMIQERNSDREKYELFMTICRESKVNLKDIRDAFREQLQSIQSLTK